jgi:hypothetical protein
MVEYELPEEEELMNTLNRVPARVAAVAWNLYA